MIDIVDSRWLIVARGPGGRPPQGVGVLWLGSWAWGAGKALNVKVRQALSGFVRPKKVLAYGHRARPGATSSTFPGHAGGTEINREKQSITVINRQIFLK